MTHSIEPSRVDEPGRRAKEDAARRLWYPTSEWGERVEGEQAYRTLLAVIEPVPPVAELPLILADLRRGAIVSLEPGGHIRHDDRCHARHELPVELQHPEALLGDPAFIVEATFYTMKRDPAVRILDPEISLRTHPGHPHFYANGIVCPVFPPDKTWTWTDSVTDYLDHVSIWLLKTLVWNATARMGTARWLGDDVHEPPDVFLRRVDRNDPCPCASGEIYRRCCRQLHLDIVNGRVRVVRR